MTPTTTRATKIVGQLGASIGGPPSCPDYGQTRPARHSGRVALSGGGRSTRAGRATARPGRSRSAPRNERVESRPSDLAMSHVPQDHASREVDLRIAIDRPDDPLDVGRLDDRHVAQAQARELAEPQAGVQGLWNGRQVGFERGPAATERRAAGRRRSGRFAPLGGTRPRRQSGEWTAIQRPQRRVARPQQRAGIYAGRHRPAGARPWVPARAAGPAVRRAIGGRAVVAAARSGGPGAPRGPRRRVPMSSPPVRIAQLLVRGVDLGHRAIGPPLQARIAAGDVRMVLTSEAAPRDLDGVRGGVKRALRAR